MRALLPVVLSFAACLCEPAAAMDQVVLVVERSDARGEARGRLLESTLKDKVDIRWLRYSAESLGDPIYKGKLLAAMSGARLVVSVGDDATALALDELEDVPIYFVGASKAAGARLSQRNVSGVLGYSPEDVFKAAPPSWRASLGLLYTPGYEPVVESIRAAAAKADVALVERRVTDARDIPSAARELMARARAVWPLGDPLLSRGPGFAFLADLSLAQGVPMIGSDEWEVKRGAVFCSRAPQNALADRESEDIVALLEGVSRRPRVVVSQGGGQIVFQRVLAARNHLSPKSHWVEVK